MAFLKLSNGTYKHESCGWGNILPTDNFCSGCGLDLDYFKQQLLTHKQKLNETIETMRRGVSKDK